MPRRNWVEIPQVAEIAKETAESGNEAGLAEFSAIHEAQGKLTQPQCSMSMQKVVREMYFARLASNLKALSTIGSVAISNVCCCLPRSKMVFSNERARRDPFGLEEWR